MKILYLSYDGMTDPLGRSQVLPYIEGLVALGHKIHIVSCDKPEIYASGGQELKEYLESKAIGWTPLVYHKSPRILSTIWDIAAIVVAAIQLRYSREYDILHCRSYPAGLAGLVLHSMSRVKLLFDMRGFWADEKVDGLSWDRDRPLYNAVYLFFKAVEKALLARADAVVALTDAAKSEMLTWGIKGLRPERICVIPCCADLSLFDRRRVDQEHSAALVADLDLQDAGFVLVYVGSLGSWYMLDEMLKLFRNLRKQFPRATFLFATREPRDAIDEALSRVGVHPGAVRVVSASREQLPVVLKVATAGIFFRKAVYSAMAASPTKLAEMLSMGLPVITNTGIGDGDLLAEECDIGPVATAFNREEYDRIVAELPGYLSRPPQYFRSAAEKHFTLDEGVRRYNTVYCSMCG